MVWSYILDFENHQNPFQERKIAADKWKQYFLVYIVESAMLLKKAKAIHEVGIKAKDALHIASAIEGGAKYFISTDHGILKKARRF